MLCRRAVSISETILFIAYLILAFVHLFSHFNVLITSSSRLWLMFTKMDTRELVSAWRGGQANGHLHK